MPRRLAEADSSEQAPGAFGFPCCGPAPFANYPFDIIDIGSQVESRQPFQSPEVGLTQSIKAGHVRNGLRTAIRCTLHQGPHSLDSSARQQKKSVAIPPRPTYHEGKPDGGMFRDHDAGFVGTLTPSTISRFCASLIPAEYNP